MSDYQITYYHFSKRKVHVVTNKAPTVAHCAMQYMCFGFLFMLT